MTRRTAWTLALALAAAPVGRLPAEGPAPARPRITGLSHVAFWVKDLAASRAFYKGFLGFDEPYTLTNADGSVSLTWIKINDRQSLELFPITARTPAGGDSLYHIALETDDAQAMLGYLRARGVRGPGGSPLPATAGKGRIGNLNFFAEDPDRHTVEFVQYEPDGWTLANAGKFMPATRVSSRMSHAGITVRSLERSLAFYRDILGLTETWRGSSDGVTLSWVNERLPEGADYLELMLVAKEPPVEQLHILHHVCLEVASTGAVAGELKARALPAGCRAPDPERLGRNHKRQVNCYDPDGTRVEVMEAAPVGGPAPSSPAPPPAPGG
jgi:lactoylglutathione lyase